MAGTIDVATGRWQASSRLFYWAVTTVADAVDDPETVRALLEIDEANLGHLDVDELPRGGQEDVLRALAGLGDRADKTLPPSAGRGDLVAYVRELSTLAAVALDATP